MSYTRTKEKKVKRARGQEKRRWRGGVRRSYNGERGRKSKKRVERVPKVQRLEKRGRKGQEFQVGMMRGSCKVGKREKGVYKDGSF